MSEAKREVWVLEDSNGYPTAPFCDKRLADAMALGKPVTRYIPEHSARESAQGEGWKRAPAELPDSDLMVVVATEEHDDYAIAVLEFTDDSEGHGEPYWSCDGGDLAICNYPNWMLLAPKEGK